MDVGGMTGGVTATVTEGVVEAEAEVAVVGLFEILGARKNGGR